MNKIRIRLWLCLLTIIFLTGCTVDSGTSLIMNQTLGFQTETQENLNSNGENIKQGIGTKILMEQAQDAGFLLDNKPVREGHLYQVIAVVDFDQENKIQDIDMAVSKSVYYLNNQGEIISQQVEEAKEQEALGELDAVLSSGELNSCGVNWFTAGNQAPDELTEVERHGLYQIQMLEEWALGKTYGEIKFDLSEIESRFFEASQESEESWIKLQDYLEAIESAYKNSK